MAGVGKHFRPAIVAKYVFVPLLFRRSLLRQQAARQQQVGDVAARYLRRQFQRTLRLPTPVHGHFLVRVNAAQVHIAVVVYDAHILLLRFCTVAPKGGVVPSARQITAIAFSPAITSNRR